jgi:hypothetical protein
MMSGYLTIRVANSGEMLFLAEFKNTDWSDARMARKRFREAFLVIGLTFIPRVLAAQVSTGTVEGFLRDADAHPRGGAAIVVSGGAGFRSKLETNANGAFALVAPYGRYQLSPDGALGPESFGVEIYVAPLQITHVDLQIDESGAFHLVKQSAEEIPGLWSNTSGGRTYPDGFTVQSALLNREPESEIQPLDYTGLAANRLPLESRGALSWTDTQYKLDGMDATDSYQPGGAAVVPDIEALSDVVARGSFAQVGSGSAGTEVSLFSREANSSWHGAVSTADTGSLLTSANLPPPDLRGLVQQPDQFIWFTRDRFEAGGPIKKWADLFASVAGQWALQTVPLASVGTNQGSQMLFGDLRSRIRASAKDQLDLVYSGSRVSLSDGGVPADFVDLMSRRMAPSFVLPGGFQNESEADQFNYLQAGWTHELPAASNLGVLQVRFGYSMVHLNTTPVQQDGTPRQSSIELVGGMVSGASPIADLATRARQEVTGAWVLDPLRIGSSHHQIAIGADWEGSSPTDRVTTPSDMNLVTVNGSAAFAVEFNTPLVAREVVRSSSLSITDHGTFSRGLSLDAGVFADFSRGSLPAQSSPAGDFAPPRVFAAQPDLITWNSISPRFGLAWRVPHSRGLVLRGGYFRLHAPLAGRDLDFGNPNSLGGSQYQWNDLNSDGLFEPSEQGALLLRFGGPYSSISPSLRRPYADQFNVGVELVNAKGDGITALFYHRDDEARLAALDTGVAAGAYTPMTITDPGDNGIPGTIEQRALVVYAQNPATFGEDRYVLSNPPGLRTFTEGISVEVNKKLRALTLRAALASEESFGPTNPGDGVLENDPGIVGALLMDPNTTVFASSRSFMDRAYLIKTQISYRLPRAWSGVELDSVVDYNDGLPFGRELLVTGLPQGPLLVGATQRGSSGQGGYRAEAVVNWNLRLRRDFHVPVGTLSGVLDILNALDYSASLQENDISGAAFTSRLPVVIQPPRNVRVELDYEF